VSALSYDGTLSVTLLADATIADLPTMAEGMREAFDGYRKAVPSHRSFGAA